MRNFRHIKHPKTFDCKNMNQIKRLESFTWPNIQIIIRIIK